MTNTVDPGDDELDRAFLALADVLARTAGGQAEIPIGVVTAFFSQSGRTSATARSSSSKPPASASSGATSPSAPR